MLQPVPGPDEFLSLPARVPSEPHCPRLFLFSPISIATYSRASRRPTCSRKSRHAGSCVLNHS
jgi:hypothetical protein